MIPTRACVSAKRARSDATRKSHVSATSNPPVTAAPLIAPITGLVVSGNGRISSSSPRDDVADLGVGAQALEVDAGAERGVGAGEHDGVDVVARVARRDRLRRARR